MLDPNTLRDQILLVTAPPFPPTAAAAKLKWAAAFSTYFAAAVAPVWTPEALTAGQSAFVIAWDPMTPAKLEDALAAMAAAMCAALPTSVPPSPWTATPPAVPVMLPALPPTFDPIPPATAVAVTVDAWARLGLATLAANPPVPWS